MFVLGKLFMSISRFPIEEIITYSIYCRDCFLDSKVEVNMEFMIPATTVSVRSMSLAIHHPTLPT